MHDDELNKRRQVFVTSFIFVHEKGICSAEPSAVFLPLSVRLVETVFKVSAGCRANYASPRLPRVILRDSMLHIRQLEVNKNTANLLHHCLQIIVETIVCTLPVF
ncbi:hypothetical protein BaRGS_00020728 [Batillaria attramentaria]|uniref:Uncharacterized protein n=1 Tax=Batillaria attramentaria TaxID=370345 RepID=A0ABD0KLU0_9CAEN